MAERTRRATARSTERRSAGTSAATSTEPARGGRLRDVKIGTVPILWNNADLPDLGPVVPADVVLDEIARLGYEGTQTGVGFPAGAELVGALARRNLRLAEVYAALSASTDGPLPEAEAAGRMALEALAAADGDVLVAALALSPDRITRAGRADAASTPRLTDAGWRRLGRLLDGLATQAEARGRRLSFHPHAGTFVETPAEVDRLLAATDPDLVGLCLDVGHYTIGGGDPVAAIRTYAPRIDHVHLKDVAPEPLADLRRGEIGGFLEALRARIFVELGAGVVDIQGILEALAAADYRGWIMLEQDTTWRPPAESAAISRRVLAYAIRHLDREARTTPTGAPDPATAGVGRTPR
ncbi:MAG TPA: sugar phosphate isomerase/epimerase [Candidatus Limnocylindrales bacterium]|nr:sugar phosphate isomerase/epimerase [Candidatus Limnocylindrales bacterium]